MAKLVNLTKAQKDKFSVWVDKWVKIGLRTGEPDWNTFERYIRVVYKKANIVFPEKIIRVNSPLVGALAASLADTILTNNAVGGAVDDAVDDAVGGAVYDAVGGVVDDAVGGVVRGAVDGAVRVAVGGAVGGVVGGAVHDDVNSIVRDAVDDAVRVAVRDAVRVAVGGAVDGKGLRWHGWFGGQFWVGGWWGSPSYVSFFTDVCNLELSEDIMERATAYRKICESVNYFWCNKNFVMVCARPKVINLNERCQLHSDTGKSIEYPDGWGLYHLNGVSFSKELWKRVVSKNMPFADILKIKDIDQRTQAMKYGDVDEFLKYMKAELVDGYLKHTPDMDEVKYWLYKIPKNDVFKTDVFYMIYTDPSTGEKYMSGVPESKTVAEAMAWKCSDEEYVMSPSDWVRMKPLIDES